MSVVFCPCVRAAADARSAIATTGSYILRMYASCSNCHSLNHEQPTTNQLQRAALVC